ncbi:MAG: ATP-binding cassette domain-containing protein, partial [Candidatus Methylomirabilis sp.]|nr:ATP-binding cassette domain-containing protein [Deltaproteobacteria bacterium]
YYLRTLPWVLCFVVLGKGLADVGQGYLMRDVGLSIVNDFRVVMFRHLQRMSLRYFTDNPTGTLVSRITFDVGMIRVAVTDLIIDSFKNAVSVVGYVGLAFYMNWKFATIAFFILPIAWVPIIQFGRKARKISKRTQGRVGRLTMFLDEVISGARVVKAFGMEEYENRRFEEESGKLLKLNRKLVGLDAFAAPFNEILGGVGGAIMLYVAGREVIVGRMTTGELSAFIVAVFMMYRPIKSISKLNNSLQAGLAAADRCFELLDTPPEIQDAPDAAALPPIREAIVFDRVSFAYDEAPVLQDVDLTVRKGEVVALVGPSGGGKTTLVNLVPRFYEVTGGAIRIDGQDIRHARIADLRAQIAVVTQQTILFNDTVRANIAYGDPARSDAEIRAAAEAAHATEFIDQLPQGFDTPIGEDGVKLSGGQRQRVSIARALLKNAPILILDEATSALDAESERLVQAALEVLMKDRTTLVIAHRLSTIQSADRIVVLKAGRIVEEGTHRELMDLGGEYRRLHDLQFRDEQDA